MNDLDIKIGRDGILYDFSQLFTKVVLSGRKGAAPRTAEMQIADVDKVAGEKIDCSNGQQCYLYFNGEEAFRGLLMSDSRSNKKILQLKAYDDCVRLCNNKDSFSYNGETATSIFVDCLNRLGLSLGEADDTGFHIEELVKKATTFWDVIQDALSQTYKTTGNRFCVYARQGKIYLKRRAVTESMPVLSLDTNVISYDYKKSIYDTRTRLQLTTSEGDQKGSMVNEELEQKIGRFQEVESVNEEITQNEIDQRINVFRWEKGQASKTLKVTAVGDIRCAAGGCVYVDLPEVNTRRMMFIEEDTHTFEKGKHTMSLVLSYESTEDKGAAEDKKSYSVGDIVRFNGGYHYVSSDAENPAGSKCAMSLR